jgi:predicted amidohydrolase
MQDLRVVLIQPDLVWESPQANLNQFDRLLGAVGDCDLVVLPEMFATGFSMNPSSVAVSMQSETLRWMLERSHDYAICGSLAIEEKGQFFNRFLMAYEGRILAQYDKRHLFAYAQEDQHYCAGNQVVQFEFKGWSIAPFVCYDLRFPAWIRQTAGVDLMLFVANWPSKRQWAWNSLLTARAIENQCYVLASNRVGVDGNGIAYQGDSQAISMAGEILASLRAESGIIRVTLDKGELQAFRAQFPFLSDRDSFGCI